MSLVIAVLASVCRLGLKGMAICCPAAVQNSVFLGMGRLATLLRYSFRVYSRILLVWRSPGPLCPHLIGNVTLGVLGVGWSNLIRLVILIRPSWSDVKGSVPICCVLCLFCPLFPLAIVRSILFLVAKWPLV